MILVASSTALYRAKVTYNSSYILVHKTEYSKVFNEIDN